MDQMSKKNNDDLFSRVFAKLESSVVIFSNIKTRPLASVATRHNPFGDHVQALMGTPWFWSGSCWNTILGPCLIRLPLRIRLIRLSYNASLPSSSAPQSKSWWIGWGCIAVTVFKCQLITRSKFFSENGIQKLMVWSESTASTKESL